MKEQLTPLTRAQKDHIIAAFNGAEGSYHFLKGWFKSWIGEELEPSERGTKRSELASPTEGASLSAHLEEG